MHGSVAVEFNLSHSGVLAVYAFTSGCAVGVDVELIRPVPMRRIWPRVFFANRNHGLRAFQGSARVGISGVLDPQGSLHQGSGSGAKLSPRCVRCDHRPGRPSSDPQDRSEY